MKDEINKNLLEKLNFKNFGDAELIITEREINTKPLYGSKKEYTGNQTTFKIILLTNDSSGFQTKIEIAGFKSINIAQTNNAIPNDCTTCKKGEPPIIDDRAIKELFTNNLIPLLENANIKINITLDCLSFNDPRALFTAAEMPSPEQYIDFRTKKAGKLIADNAKRAEFQIIAQLSNPDIIKTIKKDSILATMSNSKITSTNEKKYVAFCKQNQPIKSVPIEQLKIKIEELSNLDFDKIVARNVKVFSEDVAIRPVTYEDVTNSTDVVYQCLYSKNKTSDNPNAKEAFISKCKSVKQEPCSKMGGFFIFCINPQVDSVKSECIYLENGIAAKLKQFGCN